MSKILFTLLTCDILEKVVSALCGGTCTASTTSTTYPLHILRNFGRRGAGIAGGGRDGIVHNQAQGLTGREGCDLVTDSTVLVCIDLLRLYFLHYNCAAAFTFIAHFCDRKGNETGLHLS